MMNMNYVGAVLLLSLTGWLLAGCNSDAASNASATIFTGNVFADIHMAGGKLVVTDSSTPAKTFTAPIQADGSYSLNAANGAAPFLFHAQIRAGSKAGDLFSASAANSGKVNISALTSLVVANAAGQDCVVTACAPSVFTDAKLTGAAANVQSQLVPLLTQYGLAIADELDSKQGDPASARKWVFFKHIAVGGYIYSRDGPLEFIKDAATGNWRMAGIQRVKAAAKAGKAPNMYIPPPGASSFGKWLPFSTDSSIYPEGATLIVVSGSSISPTVTLVYMGGNNGAAKISGSEMVAAVADVSFLPACPRKSGQPGNCIDVAQTASGVYATAFTAPSATVHGQATQQAVTENMAPDMGPSKKAPLAAVYGSHGNAVMK